MKKKDEKAYFNDQWQLMLTHFKAFIKTDEQENLHQFRVQVKKLRAMLELLDIDSSKPHLSKDFKPVKRIFKHCGDIRNAYINLEFGVRYQFKNEEFLVNQLYAIENGINEIKTLGRKYLKTIKESHNEIADDLRPVDNKAIVEFYKTRLEEIAIALDKLQFNDELHNTRKQIKTLVYNRKIAHKALDGKLQINNDYLDKLQDLIGNWHDNILALELFSSAESNYKPVITKIKRQNTRLKRSIAVLVQDFEKKAILAVP
jgi:CHAD domain-containing protein